MRYAIFLLIMLFVLSGCVSNPAGDQENDGDLDIVIVPDGPDGAGGDGDQDAQEDETDGAIEPDGGDEDPIMVGTWHHMPGIGSAMGACYFIFEGGDYIFQYSQYDTEKTVLQERGRWSYKNGMLTLTINKKVVIEGGEKSAEPLLPGDSNEYAIVNGKIKFVDVDPPQKEEYDLSDMYSDTDEGNGHLTAVFNGTRFWKIHDYPDVYIDEAFEDGDIYKPWP